MLSISERIESEFTPLLPFLKAIQVTKRQKLLIAIRNNPNAVRFDDACNAAEILGFIRKEGKGSHRIYAKKGESSTLNFQNRNGYIASYQAYQLIAMINKYEG